MRRRITSAYEKYYFHKYENLLKLLAFRFVSQGTVEDRLSIARQELLWAMAHFDPNRNTDLITYVFSRVRGILLRQRRRQNKYDDATISFTDQSIDITCNPSGIDNLELLDFLDHCNLSSNERTALELNIGRDMTLAAIGDILDCSGTTVSNYRNSALRKCKLYARQQKILD